MGDLLLTASAASSEFTWPEAFTTAVGIVCATIFFIWLFK